MRHPLNLNAPPSCGAGHLASSQWLRPIVEIWLVVTPVLPMPPLVPSVETGFEEKFLYCQGFSGGPFRARTGDPLIKSQLLYQLS